MGGKWIIRLRKGLASRCWENLILAMLGEQFMVGEEICGAVVSVRFQVSTQRVVLPISRHCNLMWLDIYRRTSFPSGTKLRVIRQPLHASETLCVGFSTFLPTPSWNIKLIQTALSMYVSSFIFYLELFLFEDAVEMYCKTDVLHILQSLGRLPRPGEC